MRFFWLLMTLLPGVAFAETFPCQNPEAKLHVDQTAKIERRAISGRFVYDIYFPEKLQNRDFTYAELFVGSPESSGVSSQLHVDDGDLSSRPHTRATTVETLNNSYPISVVAHYGPFNCTTTSRTVVYDPAAP